MSRLRRGPSWGPSTKSCRAGSGEARVAPGRGDCPLRRFRAEPCCGGSSPANVLHFLVKGHALRRLQETSGGRAPSPPSATVPSSSIYHTRCPKVHKEKWGLGLGSVPPGPMCLPGELPAGTWASVPVTQAHTCSARRWGYRVLCAWSKAPWGRHRQGHGWRRGRLRPPSAHAGRVFPLHLGPRGPARLLRLPLSPTPQRPGSPSGGAWVALRRPRSRRLQLQLGSGRPVSRFS